MRTQTEEAWKRCPKCGRIENQITQAKELDLLTCLQRYAPHALVHVGGNTYCTREHDSLKISNGK